MDKLFEQALQLPEKQRGELAGRLLRSLAEAGFLAAIDWYAAPLRDAG
ncbi:MAG TPA: hypothetical protein VFK02_18150 [Kofleriaceae bacterium]|nr:hypothetical protein [Kofleriaceae bacterium]